MPPRRASLQNTNSPLSRLPRNLIDRLTRHMDNHSLATAALVDRQFRTTVQREVRRRPIRVRLMSISGEMWFSAELPPRATVHDLYKLVSRQNFSHIPSMPQPPLYPGLSGILHRNFILVRGMPHSSMIPPGPVFDDLQASLLDVLGRTRTVTVSYNRGQGWKYNGRTNTARIDS
jgi:hypothetical protein